MDANDSTPHTRLANGLVVGAWKLDASRSSLALKSKSMWKLVTVKGTFDDVSGDALVQPDGNVSGHLIVSAASVNTRNKKRDEHLKSADFFEAAKYPQIVFTLTSLNANGASLEVAGTLKVKTISRPLSFPATLSVLGDRDVALDGSVDIDRANFGMTWNKMGMVSMINALSVHAVFTLA